MIDLIEQLKTAVFNFLIDLQTTRAVNEKEFKRIIELSGLFASEMHGVDLVSKSALNQLYVFCQVCRAEAPYIVGKTEDVLLKAHEVDYMLSLILRNDLPSIPS